MIQTMIRGTATILLVALVVLMIGTFPRSGDAGILSTELAPGPSTDNPVRSQRLTPVTSPSDVGAGLAAAEEAATASVDDTSGTTSPTVATAGAGSSPTTVAAAPSPAPAPSPAAALSTATSTTTTTAPAVSTGSGMFLWDSAWQIAAKANEAGMQQYVDRLAAAQGSSGANFTGFWFSVVNQNQDINTANGFGHTFGSYSSPNADYLNDVETLIAKASGRGLRVGILVGWDGSNQFSVESGKLNSENAYQYGYTIASQWTRPDFGGRWAISSWIMGGDTTSDSGGEHGAVWAEVVRGIQAAEAANGFGGATILFHTAPGQQLHYVGAPWLDAHAPQTGHCADAATAVNWINELRNTGARVWGNGEMRYEDIAWSCNDMVPISADQVLADTIAMGNLGYMANFVYGHDTRWNSSWPGSNGLFAGGGVSPGLQKILDQPGLIRPR